MAATVTASANNPSDPGSNPNPITTPYTIAQLQTLAQQQAASTITGEVAPLQSQVKTYQGEQAQARQDISQEGSQLLPYVNASAQAVQSSQDEATQQEMNVFAAEGTRMNQVHQQLAAQAQQLAQQMGGPVSTADFTQSIAPYEAQVPAAQAGGVLNALGVAQGNTEEAQAFAGQVFPALMTNEQAKSDAFFNDQIKTLNDTIDKYQASKSDLVNTNLATLLEKERAFTAQQATLAMDKTKMARDWQVQEQAVDASQERDKLAKEAAKLAGIRTATEVTRANIEKYRAVHQVSEAQARLGLQRQALQARVQHENLTSQVGIQRLQESYNKDVQKFLQTAGVGGKTISMTHRAFLPKGSLAALSAQSGKGSYYYSKDAPAGMTHWYKIAHETTASNTAGTPISDPNKLYDMATNAFPNLPKPFLIKQVRARTGLTNWVPGQQVVYGSQQLHRMPLPELGAVAKDKGYKGKTGKAYRQAMTDFILQATPPTG